MRSVRLPSTLRPLLGALALGAALQASAGTGTYLFNGNLAAYESGAPSLTAVDPLGQNSFGTATLYGATRSVYNTSGIAGDYANNAGLLLDGSSLVSATQYSLEMVVSLAATNGYRKLADTSGRASDNGFYVHDGVLDVYPQPNGGLPVATGVYNYLVLTVSNDTVKGYVNGALDFTTTTNVMDGNAFDFFLDDSHTGGGEYSNVSVGLLRLQSGVLSDAQIKALSINPYAPVPEPTTIAALGLGALAVLRRRRVG